MREWEYGVFCYSSTAQFLLNNVFVLHQIPIQVCKILQTFRILFVNTVIYQTTNNASIMHVAATIEYTMYVA